MLTQVSDVLGGLRDHCLRIRTERAQRLERKVEQFSRWTVVLLLALILWHGYFFWQQELLPDLETYRSHGVFNEVAVSAGESRESLFYIFSVVLAGPVVLLIAWMLLGLGYNLMRDLASRLFPLARYVVLPALLLFGMQLADGQRERLRAYVIEVYAVVDVNLGKARQQRLPDKEEIEQLRALQVGS